MLFELSRLSASVSDGRGTIEHAQKAAEELEKLSAKGAVPPGSGVGDVFEVTVKDGSTGWKKTFRTTSAALSQYAASVGTRNGGSPIAFSLQAKSATNIETGVEPDSSGEPPSCVSNVVGVYEWTTDNRSTTLGTESSNALDLSS
jgi:hypothetical protein